MKKQVSAFVATLIISASVPGAALASQRLCSAVTPGNWRDTIEAPPNGRRLAAQTLPSGSRPLRLRLAVQRLPACRSANLSRRAKPDSPTKIFRRIIPVAGATTKRLRPANSRGLGLAWIRVCWDLGFSSELPRGTRNNYISTAEGPYGRDASALVACVVRVGEGFPSSSSFPRAPTRASQATSVDTCRGQIDRAASPLRTSASQSWISSGSSASFGFDGAANSRVSLSHFNQIRPRSPSRFLTVPGSISSICSFGGFSFPG